MWLQHILCLTFSVFFNNSSRLLFTTEKEVIRKLLNAGDHKYLEKVRYKCNNVQIDPYSSIVYQQIHCSWHLQHYYWSLIHHPFALICLLFLIYSFFRSQFLSCVVQPEALQGARSWLVSHDGKGINMKYLYIYTRQQLSPLRKFLRITVFFFKARKNKLQSKGCQYYRPACNKSSLLPRVGRYFTS